MKFPHAKDVDCKGTSGGSSAASAAPPKPGPLALRLYHGTSTNLEREILKLGLLPSRKRGYLYATPSKTVAMLYAYARGSQRGSSGLMVEFETDGEEWSVDDTFPWR